MRYLCGKSRTAVCGTCTMPQTCGGGGVVNVCGCTETDAAFCTRLGKNCGSVSAPDKCGVARTVASCGTCASPQTCNTHGLTAVGDSGSLGATWRHDGAVWQLQSVFPSGLRAIALDGDQLVAVGNYGAVFRKK
jgi:hypothetical protein